MPGRAGGSGPASSPLPLRGRTGRRRLPSPSVCACGGSGRRGVGVGRQPGPFLAAGSRRPVSGVLCLQKSVGPVCLRPPWSAATPSQGPALDGTHVGSGPPLAVVSHSFPTPPARAPTPAELVFRRVAAALSEERRGRRRRRNRPLPGEGEEGSPTPRATRVCPRPATQRGRSGGGRGGGRRCRSGRGSAAETGARSGPPKLHRARSEGRGWVRGPRFRRRRALSLRRRRPRALRALDTFRPSPIRAVSGTAPAHASPTPRPPPPLIAGVGAYGQEQLYRLGRLVFFFLASRSPPPPSPLPPSSPPPPPPPRLRVIGVSAGSGLQEAGAVPGGESPGRKAGRGTRTGRGRASRRGRREGGGARQFRPSRRARRLPRPEAALGGPWASRSHPLPFCYAISNKRVMTKKADRGSPSTMPVFRTRYGEPSPRPAPVSTEILASTPSLRAFLDRVVSPPRPAVPDRPTHRCCPN